MQNTSSFEKIPNNQNNNLAENTPNMGISNGMGQTEQRREVPRQGFTNSNPGSNGSGGAPHPSSRPPENEKEVTLNNPSYNQTKNKQDDRNALSQDCGVEIKQMDVNKNNFDSRKGSANHNMLDFTFPHNQMNRNFKQKVSKQ